jgi:hypothetical protein
VKRAEIIKALGIGNLYVENKNRTALEISLSDDRVNVSITLPYEVSEIYYEANGIDGAVFVKDWHDHYGESEEEDYINTLKIISSAIKSPSFRVTNNQKTIELVGAKNTYFFGEFSS